MSPFDITPMTSYLTLMETASIMYCFRVIASYLSEVTDFNLPHMHFTSPLDVIPFEFCGDLSRKKTRVPRLLRGFACMILRLAILIYWRVMYRQTDGHMMTANTALA